VLKKALLSKTALSEANLRIGLFKSSFLSTSSTLLVLIGDLFGKCSAPRLC
jgi:hypothetical protein